MKIFPSFDSEVVFAMRANSIFRCLSQKENRTWRSCKLKMDKNFAHRIFSFKINTKGSVAIEFAIVGMACIWLIVETMQAGFFFYVSAALNNATAKAARQILTGSVSQNGLTAAQFRTQVLCPFLPSAMACSSIVTNIQSVSEDVQPNGFYQFVNSRQTAVITPAMDNSKTTFCSGGAGTVIYAQVYFAMPVFSPAWRAAGTTMFNGIQSHLVSAAAVFKNEPFQAATSSGC